MHTMCRRHTCTSPKQKSEWLRPAKSNAKLADGPDNRNNLDDKASFTDETGSVIPTPLSNHHARSKRQVGAVISHRILGSSDLCDVLENDLTCIQSEPRLLRTFSTRPSPTRSRRASTVLRSCSRSWAGTLPRASPPSASTPPRRAPTARRPSPLTRYPTTLLILIIS